MLNRDQLAYYFLLNSETLLVKEAFDKADEFIAEAEKRKCKERPAVIGGWISVEDQLPKEFKSVAAYSADKGVFPAWVVDSNKWRNHLHYITDITHWQPLPTPPKGESE